MLLYAVFKLLQIDVVILASSQTADEKIHIIDQFNHAPKKAMVLIVIYVLGSVGIKLYYTCWRVHCIECPNYVGVVVQVFGRVRRLGNVCLDKVVYFDQYRFRAKIKKYLTLLSAPRRALQYLIVTKIESKED